MKKTEITCDQCGSDLTRTGNCEDYRIVLANEGIPSGGGFVTSMAIYPPLAVGCAHFCGTPCLGKWISEQYPNAVADYDKAMERHRARDERAASAIEARRAATENTGAVHESAGPQDDAPVQP